MNSPPDLSTSETNRQIADKMQETAARLYRRLDEQKEHREEVARRKTNAIRFQADSDEAEVAEVDREAAMTVAQDKLNAARRSHQEGLRWIEAGRSELEEAESEHEAALALLHAAIAKKRADFATLTTNVETSASSLSQEEQSFRRAQDLVEDAHVALLAIETSRKEELRLMDVHNAAIAEIQEEFDRASNVGTTAPRPEASVASLPEEGSRISGMFPTVLFHQGEYYACACPSCGANASKQTGFFKGLAAFATHYRKHDQTHRAPDLLTSWASQKLSTEDVNLLKQVKNNDDIDRILGMKLANMKFRVRLNYGIDSSLDDSGISLGDESSQAEAAQRRVTRKRTQQQLGPSPVKGERKSSGKRQRSVLEVRSDAGQTQG